MAQADHDVSVATAKTVLQQALSGSPSATANRTAHIAYYRAVLASARANGIQTGALQALHSLGVFDSGKAGDT